MNKKTGKLICPAGKALYIENRNYTNSDSGDYKELYHRFENMFFFASDGTGGFFAYLKDGNK
jgi:hypothetical protein